MADELFGAASGFRIGEQDRLRAAEAMGRIAMQPAELRLKTAEAGAKELHLSNEQRMAEIMARSANEPGVNYSDAGPVQPQSQTPPLMKLADISMKSGLWEQSIKLSNAALLQQSREAAAISARATAAKNINTLELAHLNRLDGLMANVTDQASLDTANTMYSMMFPGKTSPLAGAQYSPDLIDNFSNSLITAKDRAHNNILAAEYGSRKENRNSQIDYRKFRIGILQSAEERAQQREDRLAKAGGAKGLTAPSTQEVNMARDLVLGEVYGGKIPADDDEMNALQMGARSIASRAKSMIRENPAMDWKTAVQRAYNESQAAGEWVGAPTLMGYGKEKKLYKGMGKTAETAVQLPAKATGETDAAWASKLSKGTFYVNSKGQVGQWTGTGFSLVAAPAGRAGAGAGVGVDEEGDDDADDED